MKIYGVLFFVLLFLIDSTAINCNPEVRERRNVILDVDTSGDDLMAILFLLARPDIDIKAITIVQGVSNVDKGTEIVLRLLSLTGHTDIPVAKGAEFPLEGKNAFPLKWQPDVTHAFGLELPPQCGTPSELTAQEMISQLLEQYRGNISILALGPLTNIARVFTAKPALVKNVRNIVVSDGAVYVKGAINLEYPAIHNAVSGWNQWVDAKAASKVFGSGAKITLVPLDLTAVHSPNPILLRSAVVQSYNSRIDDPVRKSLATLLNKWIAYYHTDTKISDTEDQAPVWDLVAAEIFVNPDICTERQNHSIKIRTGDPETAGQIILTQEKHSNVTICLKGDQALFDAVLLQ